MGIEIVIFILVLATNIICWYAGWLHALRKPKPLLNIFVALVAYVLSMDHLLSIRDALFFQKNYIYYFVSIAIFLLYVYIARKAFLRAKY